MNISLTPELELRVKAKVESGLYNNASEVIRDALRFMETHEQWIYQLKVTQLREQLEAGILQMEQGKGITVNSEAELKELFGNLKK